MSGCLRRKNERERWSKVSEMIPLWLCIPFAGLLLAPIFVLPTLLAFTIGFIIPFLEGLYLAFCQFTTVRDATFIGIGNFQRIFSDTTFLHSFKFTVLFAVAAIVFIN